VIGSRNPPVARIGNTSESIIPRQKSRKNSKGATSLDGTTAWCTVNAVKVANTEAEEGEVKSEEEGEEGDCRFERAEEEQEGEDKPALNRWISIR